MQEPSAAEADLRPPILRIFRVLFWGVVVPFAVLVLAFIGYVIFYLGIEHY